MVTEGLKAEIKFSFDANSWNQILRGGSPHTWYARMRDDDNNLVYEEKSLWFKYVKLYFFMRMENALYIWKDVSTTTGCSGNIGLEHSFYTTSGIIR